MSIRIHLMKGSILKRNNHISMSVNSLSKSLNSKFLIKINKGLAERKKYLVEFPVSVPSMEEFLAVTDEPKWEGSLEEARMAFESSLKARDPSVIFAQSLIKRRQSLTIQEYETLIIPLITKRLQEMESSPKDYLIAWGALESNFYLYHPNPNMRRSN